MGARDVLAFCITAACFAGCAAQNGVQNAAPRPAEAPSPAAAPPAESAVITEVAEDTAAFAAPAATANASAAPPPAPYIEEDFGPESPPTSGTCVGRSSKAALKGGSKGACCYTPAGFFQRQIHTRWEDIQACYQDAAKRNPKTHGIVVSKFTIEEDGSIAGACDAGSTVGDPKLVSCVGKALMKVQFPAYTAGDPCGAVTLMYPIRFQPNKAP